MNGFRIALIGALLIATATGCDHEYCDASELSDALDDASSGDTIRVGACRIEGSFVVRSGVVLEGADRDRSVLVSDGAGPVLTLNPEIAGVIGDPGIAGVIGDPGTLIRGLTVVSDDAVGIVAEGEGEVSLEQITVQASRGVGMAAEGLTALTLTEVTFEGPVTPGNVDDLPADADPLDTATHGLLLIDINEAVLTDVMVTGFAEFGAFFAESSLEWRGGGVPANSGTGLMVHGGHVALEGLDLCDTINSFHRLMPSYAGVFTAGAEIETSGLEVCNGENYGLLHDSARVVHENLSAHGNSLTALWAQSCPSFELSGADSQISDNGFAGLVIFESQIVTVVDAQIDSSRWGAWTFAEAGSIRVGDGVQVVRPTGPVLLEGLSLSANERVGVLIDLADEPESLTIEGVEVEGSGEQFGALAQGPGVPDGWDENVTRTGDAEDNDALAEHQQIVSDLTSAGTTPDTPIADGVVIADEGIAGVIGDPGAL